MFDQQLKSELLSIAHDYGLEPAALFAVTEVESAGKLGARVKGKLEPLIRFEGHYFYKLLPRTKRHIAITKGLASPKAGKVRNPLRQASRWRLLERAMKIDRDAALSSCSWGCGQVMGAHWRWLEYMSIAQLVAEARSGAAGQVLLMMRFIDKANLIEKLLMRDWQGFARAYNGPAYKKYKYDLKLQRAYLQYRKILGRSQKEHVFPQRNHISTVRLGSEGDAVRDLQQALSQLGYPLVVDGDFGPATERMLKAFQTENNLDADGIYGPKSLEMLQRKQPPQILSGFG